MMQEFCTSTYEIKSEKNTNCYTLCIMSKSIVKDLADHGISDRKSLTIEFPDVPDEYFWSYMRGLTDGDGHVRPIKCKTRQICVQINGNRQYLTKMLSLLKGKIGCPSYALNTQGKSAAVGIVGQYAYKCLKEMYLNNLWGLPRKKQAALEAIKNYDTTRKLVCYCGNVVEHAHHNRRYCETCSMQKGRECRARYKARCRAKSKRIA